MISLSSPKKFILISEKTAEQSITMSGSFEIFYPNIEINTDISKWLKGMVSWLKN